MDITWHGHSCFTIKGKDAVVVTDPYKNIGLNLPKLKADIVTISHEHDGHNNFEAVEGARKVITWPGEYELKNVSVIAIEAFHYSKGEAADAEKRGKIIIFVIDIDGFKICHLGDLGHKLTSDITEAIGDVDILLIPVGGKNTIDYKKAVEVIEQIEPRIVIPMHYKTEGSTADIDTNEKFLKEEGIANIEVLEKFSAKLVSDLPDDKTDFKVLKANVG
jgi:L-ascorbate metabolism protein UlaG (beta-lactamase superfamily)